MNIILTEMVNFVQSSKQTMKQTVEIDGIPLCYDVSGEGKPLILMHGWGCNHTTVASIARTAAESHRVYNIDLPGFGDTPEPKEPWTVDRYTQFIERFIAKMQLEAPVLVGHSFGGRIAILLASRNPVSKVVLVDAAGVKPRRSLRYYAKVYSFKFMRRMANLFLGKKNAAKWIEKQRAKSGSADYAAASPMMRAILSLCVNDDLQYAMPSIKAPTLLIWGENDTATPIRDAHRMEKLIAGSGLVSFPGCGHYSFLDNPVQFAAVLRSFLNS